MKNSKKDLDTRLVNRLKDELQTEQEAFEERRRDERAYM